MNREEIILKNKLVNVLWSAFIVASLVYGFVIFYLNKGNISEFQFSALTSTLLGVGLVNIIAGYLIHNKIKSLLTKRNDLNLDSLYSRFITLNLISWALIESAAALGLVCSFIEKNGIYYITLGLPALVILLKSKPKPELLKSILLNK